MSLVFSCAIIESIEENSKTDASDIINKLGFEVHEKSAGLFPFYEVNCNSDLLIRKIANKYILFGSCLDHLSNIILSHKSLHFIRKNKLTIHLFFQDFEYQSFFIAYHEGGRSGPANQVVGSKKKAWGRTFTKSDLPIPHSQYVKSSLDSMANFLNADCDLVKRIYSGMHGKGNYGLGYHPEKKAWVACKKGIVPEDTELQEINQLNYKKKGVPFKRTSHPQSNKSFYNQTELTYEIHQLTIENLVGFRLDNITEHNGGRYYEKFSVQCLE